MDTVYLISLIVGGFFVLLSIFGGGETDGDAEVEADFDADHDADLSHGDVGTGLVDLLSIRALFLFAAFFGLTGFVLTRLRRTADAHPVRAHGARRRPRRELRHQTVRL